MTEPTSERVYADVYGRATGDAPRTDTPRTDASAMSCPPIDAEHVDADLARTLERELAEANRIHWAAREETAKNYLAIKAENAALRWALQRIADYDAPDAHAMIEQARAALAGKQESARDSSGYAWCDRCRSYHPDTTPHVEQPGRSCEGACRDDGRYNPDGPCPTCPSPIQREGGG